MNWRTGKSGRAIAPFIRGLHLLVLITTGLLRSERRSNRLAALTLCAMTQEDCTDRLKERGQALKDLRRAGLCLTRRTKRFGARTKPCTAQTKGCRWQRKRSRPPTKDAAAQSKPTDCQTKGAGRANPPKPPSPAWSVSPSLRWACR